MLKKLVLMVLFFTGLTGPARGETVDEILALYTEGRFTQAMEKGRALGTVDGLNLAVRSQFILFQYTFVPQLRRSVIERAMVDAWKAYDMDPDNLEATTNLRIIIALRVKYERNGSDGRESRNLFRTAVEMDPQDCWALGALTSWQADTFEQAVHRVRHVTVVAETAGGSRRVMRVLGEPVAHFLVTLQTRPIGLHAGRELVRRVSVVPPMTGKAIQLAALVTR